MRDVPPTMPPPPVPLVPADGGAEGPASLGQWAQPVVAVLIVLGAVVFLIGHFTGVFARWRRARKPDVPVGRLVRGKRDDAPDDCCR